MLPLLSALAQGPNNSGTYYQNADGKKGSALKTALCGIIYDRNEGGPLNTAYKALWTHFEKTDKKTNGTVWDMYSNKQPMYTDLHHMYPTDKLVNQKRANYPFGETKGESYESHNSFSKLGKCTYSGYTGTVFEPNDEYKGDFARTYFYMVTCYEEKIADWYTAYGVNGNGETKAAVMATLDGKAYPGLSSWQLEMMMKWAKNDPVSEKEINRNNAVYDIQENRNPFIDYPGLEEYIWGDKKDVAFSYDNYTSGIATIPVSVKNTTDIYTISGQRVKGHLPKGIYIRGGKKFVVK